MGLKNYTWDKIFSLLIVPSLLETIKMLLISGILATLIGFLIGVVLVGTRKDGLFPNRGCPPVSGSRSECHPVLSVYHINDFHHPAYKTDCGHLYRR